jgi:Ran GTPase-activating protein (RanGAP) involved in mRNA processing and transport
MIQEATLERLLDEICVIALWGTFSGSEAAESACDIIHSAARYRVVALSSDQREAMRDLGDPPEPG